MRHLLAILLLLTAAVHPLAHFGTGVSDCPCLHGVVIEIPPPSSGPASIAETAYLAAVAVAPSTGAFVDVPARAPPAA